MQTLIIRTENEHQLELLAGLAKELGISAEVLDDDAVEKKTFVKLAESSFAKDWSSDEDEVCTEFLKKKEYVSTR